MRGGSIAYSPATTNYYRRHDKNSSSAAIYKKDFYYKEHQIVGEVLTSLYNIDDNAVEGLHKKAMWDWFANCSDRNFAEFDPLFNKKTILSRRQEYKPNIAICSYGFKAGGAEIFPIYLANLLKKRGHSILYVNFDLAERNTAIRNLLSPEIPVLNLTNANVLNKIIDFRSAVEAFHIEVVHSHYRRIDQLISKYCSDLKVKHVVTLHGSYETMNDHDLEKHLPDLNKSVAKWVYIAAKNLSTFARLGAFDKSKFVRIDNAIEPQNINKIERSAASLPETAFIVCLVSRAIKEKGWHEAIEAVRIARQISQKDIHLLLIGEGPVYDKLDNRADDYIHALGFQNSVLEYFSLSDIGLLPSYFSGESFPASILECLAMGRPVIASDIGEIREMLTSHEGEIAGDVFKLDNGRVPVQKLAEILATYASNPELCREKVRIAKEVSKRFDPEVMAKKYESVYLS